MKRIEAAAYEWHNYGKTTIGNRSDIERVAGRKPARVLLEVLPAGQCRSRGRGKFDEAKTLGFVQKYFGAIPRPERKLDNTWTEEPAQTANGWCHCGASGGWRCRRRVSHSGRSARGHGRAASARQHPQHPTFGPTLPGAGRDGESGQRFRLRARRA